MTEKIDTSDEQCALICMVVSNPGDGPRPHAWQKRVNDLIRALRDERNDYRERMCRAIDELSHADLRASGGIVNAP